MTIGGFQSSWFNIKEFTTENGTKLQMAILKDECKDEFAQFTENKLEQMTEREPSVGLDGLSKEQLKALSEKYNIDDMTYDEYQDFLNELVDMGVLTDADRLLAGGANKVGEHYMTPVLPGMTASVRDASIDSITAASLTYQYPLDNDDVDITEWIKYRASFDSAYYYGGKQYDIGIDEANRIVSDILSAIENAS